MAGGGFPGAARVSGSGTEPDAAGPFDAFAHAAADRCGNPSCGVRLRAEVTGAFDNLIWPHLDTYNWPHLINKDAGPVRQKSYGPSRDGVQRKGRRLSPFLCTSNVEATPSAATMLSFSAAPPGFCESDTTRRRFR